MTADVNREGVKTAVRHHINRLLTRIAAHIERGRGPTPPPDQAIGSGGSAPYRCSRTKPRRRGPEPLQPFADERPDARTIAIVIVGLRRAELEQIIDMVDNMGNRLGNVPIVITDSDAFGLFRGRRVVVEYLPPPEQRARFAPDLDWELYRLRRLALLRQKWQPERIIAFGPVASALVRDWGTSLFEDAAIHAAIGVSVAPAEQH